LTGFITRATITVVERLRLFGAAGGGLFAILAVIAFAIAPGPSSAGGATVADYYSAHGGATMWQASLLGFGLVGFMGFAAFFSESTPMGSVVLISASVTAALYFVVVGAWEALGEIYGSAHGSDLDRGDAHVLYDVGIGAGHVANFSVAAFVAATAVAVLATGRRTLGVLGILVAAVELVNAPFQMAAHSDWSGDVGTALFICFLAWVFAMSVWLFALVRRASLTAHASQAKA
jgi:hypothetical protein